MSETENQQKLTKKRPHAWSRRHTVLLVAGVAVVAFVVVAWVGERRRASREKELILEERRRFEARIERMWLEYRQRELQRQDAGKDGEADEWMCDRLPCNQGDLLPMPKPAPPGQPRQRLYPDPMDPRPYRERR